MTSRMTGHRVTKLPISWRKPARGAALGLAMVLGVGLIAPDMAQAQSAEARLRKLEAEIRALQRSVFPGGDGQYFRPEVNTQTAPANPTGAPSTTAVTDILARLDAMEGQIQRLTAQVEQNGNNLQLLSAKVNALEGVDASPRPEVASAAAGQAAAATSGASAATASSAAPAVATSAPEATTPAGPSAARVAAVSKITKPQTDDAADDEYSYGFRLWDAGFYPEAQQQLRMYVDKNPSHWRASYGRNLLGRAYLDAGNPREAATWFLRNYQDDKNGARAGDSLLYLAESMIALKDTKRACIALAEFGDTYPALASGRLADQYEADRKKVSC